MESTKPNVVFSMLKIENGESLPEIMIYFCINSLGDFLYVQRRAKGRGEMAADVGLEDEANAYSDQQKLVEILKTREGMNFADHAEYMRWFTWWSNWHKHELTEEKWRELDRLISVGKTEDDFAGLRPSGDWRSEAKPEQAKA